jgi:DNA-binding transcriptional MocR family regulator
VNQNWKPNIQRGARAVYQRVIAALETDVRSGVLAPGVRLPAQRELARSLKLSVGTITKAYLEAETRGLVTSHVGRGTFVADPSMLRAGVDGVGDTLIDLSLNIVPSRPAAQRYVESLAGMKRRSDVLQTLSYAPPVGLDAHRQAAALWLAREAGHEADWNRIVMTVGAQHAMAVTVAALCRPGDTVLCEAATYYGIRSIAEHFGLSLEGLQLDHQGVLPGALDETAARSGAKVLYVMPSSQNPTGRTMSRQRRADIVAIAKRRNLFIIEDDLYAMFTPAHAGKLPTLASLAPERSFYIGGVSKSLTPGLRTGFLVCPTQHMDRVVRAVRATIFAPPTIGTMLFTQWVAEESAFEIAQAVREEIVQRAAIARKLLDGVTRCTIDDIPHFWLELPEIEAERVAGRALRAGVAVTPFQLPIVRSDLLSGLRVCLGAAASCEHLQQGLQRLIASLSPESERPELATV